MAGRDPAWADPELGAARALDPRERPRRGLGRRARRLARELARDRAGREPPDDPPLDATGSTGRARSTRAREQRHLAYDKNWLTCDNGPASPFRGRCYLAYTLVGEPRDDLAVQRSDDGGRTWSAAVTLRTPVTGVIPVVRPDGTLVLPFWSERARACSRSLQGRRRHPREPDPVRGAPREAGEPLRGPPSRGGRRSSRPRADGLAGLPLRPACDGNDVVLSQSADGATWSAPVRVTRGRNASIPTIGVEPGPVGSRSPTT